jgi:glutathione peroxidase
MKKLMVALALVWTALVAGPALADNADQTVYQFKTETLAGKPLKLSHYKGKVLLIVNVASKCGNTPQYKGLEALYEKYKDQGLVIIGFPCNQFFSQEPGDAKTIQSFCTLNYGVTFPLAHKIEVNGANKDPLYAYLETVFPGDIEWNFGKFLVDRHGHPIHRYKPKTQPETLTADIEAALAQK